MNFLDFREPVNSWTHFAGFLLAWPAGGLLWRRSRGAIVNRIAAV